MAKHTLKLIHLQVKGDWNKTITAALERATRVAAREWLRAIALSVPTWTGETRGGFAFARGTNGFLSQFLNLAIPITPTHSKKGHTPKTGGAQARYSFSSGNHVFQFYFRSDVYQWTLNEFYHTDVPEPYRERPWNLRFFGEQAYRISMNASLAKLPKITNQGMVKVTDVDFEG